MECIGRENNGPFLTSKDLDQPVKGFDRRPGQCRNRHLKVFNKIVFDHVDNQKCRRFIHLFFHSAFPLSEDSIRIAAHIKKLQPKVKLESAVFLDYYAEF